jgi:alpha-tubulin suppressor-like RCC1 family protein
MRKTLLPLCVVSLVVAAACTARPTYTCTSNPPCISENGGAGICEPSGFCSFQDTGCTESGRRYPDGAGNGLASTCVAAPAAQKCIASLGMGTAHTCLVKTDGSLWCWGDNTHGELGDGTTMPRLTPTRVSFPPNVKIMQVEAGETHTCALDADGGVWCWGENAVGQLGAGKDDSHVPVQVSVMAGDPPAPLKVTDLGLGGKHTCVVADHRVFCFGENSDGQCGVDPAVGDDVLVPTEVAGLEGITEVASGDEFTCARRDDKSVFCWGANANGELGNGTTEPSFAPVKVVLPSVGQLAAGDEHACGVKDDGSVWCWGYGQSGGIGSGTKDDKPSPVAVATGKAVFTSGEAFHTCAVAADGTLECWGANDTQQVGIGPAGDTVLSPTTVGLITVKLVALGAKHSCAVTFDGALWCWGANDMGQLGTGATGAPIALPQRIPIACP